MLLPGGGGGGGGAGAFCMKRCIAVGRNEHKEWPKLEVNFGVEDRLVAVDIRHYNKS